MISLPISNCWATTASTPAALARLITDLILVPKTPCLLAAAIRADNSGIGFINCTSLLSAAKPLSIFKKGTIFLLFHKNSALPMPSIWRSIVISNKMAPTIRSPVKTLDLINLERIL